MINEKAFWEKVQKTPGCWLWVAGKTNGGYGVFWDRQSMKRAHRIAFMLANGPIQKGMEVMHVCDNPPCVNPAHLRIGTHLDNMRDCVAKSRQSKGPGSKPGGPRISAESIQNALDRFLASTKIHSAASFRNGEFGVSIGTIINRFGSWENAIAKAALKALGVETKEAGL